jgi:hypothetical protein
MGFLGAGTAGPFTLSLSGGGAGTIVTRRGPSNADRIPIAGGQSRTGPLMPDGNGSCRFENRTGLIVGAGGSLIGPTRCAGTTGLLVSAEWSTDAARKEPDDE